MSQSRELVWGLSLCLSLSLSLFPPSPSLSPSHTRTHTVAMRMHLPCRNGFGLPSWMYYVVSRLLPRDQLRVPVSVYPAADLTPSLFPIGFLSPLLSCSCMPCLIPLSLDHHVLHFCLHFYMPSPQHRRWSCMCCCCERAPHLCFCQGDRIRKGILPWPACLNLSHFLPRPRSPIWRTVC